VQSQTNPSPLLNLKSRPASGVSKISSNSVKPSSPKQKVKSPSIHSEHEANQQFVIVWADSNFDESKPLYHAAVTKLGRITTSIYTCTDTEQCINYLDSFVDKKVFLIVSDTLGEVLVPLVFDKPQLECIYIFSQVKRQRLLWANKWSAKIKKILFDMEDVFQAIKFDTGLIGSLTPISVFRRIDVPDAIENELDQSFMYTQLLKEILIKMDHDYTAKSKLVEYCRTKYADNVLQLGLI
ncbi:unnamed protein product, partial [Rotaria magnacalcarata]